MALIFFLYQKKQRIHQENLSSLKNEYEKNLLKTQLEIQEETLEKISREIHDNIGLSLTLAKLNLTTYSDNTNSFPKIEESATLIGKALKDLSTITHCLSETFINSNGLLAALNEEIERINSIGKLRVILRIRGNTIFLDNQKELLLFRIIQEALNNVIKYAQACTAVILLNYHLEFLQLKVLDNGQGFDANCSKLRKGSGLLNMKTRTKLLNGKFKLNSSNRGTQITVIIPY